MASDSALARFTGWTGHAAPLLATASAALGIGSLFSARFNHPVLLGALATASAATWWLDYALRNRLVSENAARQAVFEGTPPELEFIGAKLDQGWLTVVVKSTNGVPFFFRSVCVTTANKVVGVVQTADAEVVPSAYPDGIFPILREPIKLDQLAENYLELRLRYYSAFASKLGNPPHLRMRVLTAAWNVRDGALERTEPRPTSPAATTSP